MTAPANPNPVVRWLTTPPCRIAFPALFEKRPTMKGGKDLAYQAVVLVPPEVPIAEFHAIIRAAMLEDWGGPRKLEGRGNPISRAEAINSFAIEELKGYRVIRAKSGYAPVVVGPDAQPILDAAGIKSGDWCRFKLSTYTWDNSFGHGVSFNVDAVQLVRAGSRIGGSKAQHEAFEPIASADDGLGDDDGLLG